MGKARTSSKKAWRKIDTSDISAQLLKVNTEEAREKAAATLADNQLFAVDTPQQPEPKGQDNSERYKFRLHKKWKLKADPWLQAQKFDPLVPAITVSNTPKQTEEEKEKKKKTALSKSGKKAAKKALLVVEKKPTATEKAAAFAEEQKQLRLAKAAPKNDLFQQFRMESKFDKVIPGKLLDNVPEHVVLAEEAKAKRLPLKGKRSRQQLYDMWDTDTPMTHFIRPVYDEAVLLESSEIKPKETNITTVAEHLAIQKANEPKKKKKKTSHNTQVVVAEPSTSTEVAVVYNNEPAAVEEKNKLARKLKRQLKQRDHDGLHKKLSLPHPGTSYMPEESEHRQAVMTAYQHELGLIKKKQSIVNSMKYPKALDREVGDDVQDGIKASAQADPFEKEALGPVAVKVSAFKSPKERRKQKAKEDKAKASILLKLKKAKRKQDTVGIALADIAKIDKAAAVKTTQRIAVVSNQLKRQSKRHAQPLSTTDVMTKDELPSSLRTLEPSSFALWSDRMRSMHNRSLVTFKSLKHTRVDGTII